MYKVRVTSILAMILMVFAVGCDKVCKSTVQEFATIQNATNRKLTLNVCKGKVYGEVQTSVAANRTSQEVSLGSHEESSVQGGMDANKSCSAADSKTEMGISLAPSSFGKVKLCYDEASKLSVIVEAYQACPSGFLEQTSTVACDTSYSN